MLLKVLLIGAKKSDFQVVLVKNCERNQEQK